jgi:hypothetical protein
MQRHCHHAVAGEKSLLDSVSVMHVDVDIYDTRIDLQ